MEKNSIEEDIKNAEHFIDSIKIDKEYKEENGWHGYYNKEIVELARILEHILSDYKRALKENEELKIKNNAIKRESEAYAEQMIRLDIEKQDYFEKYRYHLQQNESLTKEFSNVIPVQKVKDKIEELYQQDRRWSEELSEPDSNFKYIDKNLKRIKNQIDILQELLERRK